MRGLELPPWFLRPATVKGTVPLLDLLQHERKLHRDQTVTGTAGAVGASFAVAERNWTCAAF